MTFLFWYRVIVIIMTGQDGTIYHVNQIDEGEGTLLPSMLPILVRQKAGARGNKRATCKEQLSI
jgi:hypothetical protein